MGVLGKYFQLWKVAYLPSLKPCNFEFSNFSEASTLLCLIAHIETEHESDFDVGGDLTNPRGGLASLCHPSFLFQLLCCALVALPSFDLFVLSAWWLMALPLSLGFPSFLWHFGF